MKKSGALVKSVAFIFPHLQNTVHLLTLQYNFFPAIWITEPRHGFLTSRSSGGLLHLFSITICGKRVRLLFFICGKCSG